MKVLFIAESDAGDVTEMKIWTDDYSSAEGQPFSSFLDLPLSENVNVLFRDEYGNTSESLNDSIFPSNAPADDKGHSIILLFIIR